MRRSRFFVDHNSVDQTNKSIRLEDANQIRQILTVLRLRVGDELDILDGKGNIYQCRIASSTAARGKVRNGDELICQFEIALPAGGEADFRLTVALPVLRSARFEWALEKLTELGAAQIIPIILDRSVITYDGEENLSVSNLSATKFQRWQAIVREASEQSERALIPDVVVPEKFSTFVKRQELVAATKFIGAERADAQPINDAVDSTSGAKNICIAIGAEGGFTDEEFALSFTHGFKPISLGKRILRAETAAVFAASVLVSRLDK
jgi:16S rRNA (uracil1498-N3)-methyltransferase